MTERFWLDEADPAELRRRAADLERDCMLAMAAELRARADQIEGQQFNAAVAAQKEK